ncbi:hypothetical protein CGCA056_v002887 [Colletotrichum aenigma]|uniref:uncharacterized protein n=1 Tax=Colletotrichum aenigma TaxID=1215731 RepID=UPI001872EC0C|nr:uncharacterized protein CGCA056_v002887 [Colletotrichum aenigma]KAF5526047.1 hypothetical protein CGCA056_v002887 [Colletotrichum aenigma]
MILLARRVPYFLERINNSEGSRSRKKDFIPRSCPRRVGSSRTANAYTLASPRRHIISQAQGEKRSRPQ